MNNQLATERELRRALQSLVPDDLAAVRFRERLDSALSGQRPAGLLLPSGQAPVTLSLDWTAADRGRRRKRTELTVAIALVACAAVVVGVLFAVVSPGRSGNHRPSTPALNSSVPDQIRSLLLPGTIILDTYRGRGSQSFSLAPRVIPPHFDYTAYGTCSGKGTLGLGQQTIISACDGKDSFGTSGAVQDGRLVITADPTTTWQITLTIAPELQTNGMLQTPVDPDLTGPNNAVRHSGQGSTTVTFTGETPAPAPGTHYRLRMLCHGAGVTLPDLATAEVNGLQTKTCFAGHEYVWDGIRLTAPIRIRVEASSDTTWTIAIDSM